MAIAYKLVWVVGHYHLYTWVKGVKNFSNHPTNYERLHRPRHGWRDRYLYFAQQVIWLNAASYCTQRCAVNCLLGTGRVQASIYSGLEPAANCRIKEDVKHVCFFSWVCCGCSWKGNRKLVPLFPRKPIKGVMSSLSIIDRIYASIASCIFIEVLGIKHYSPQNHLIWIMMTTNVVLFCYWYKHIVDILSRLKQSPSVRYRYGVLKKIHDRSICICYIFIEHKHIQRRGSVRLQS
jgi:hypothetical protein